MSSWLSDLTEVLRDECNVFRRDIRVIRKIEPEIVHLVGDGQVHDAILLDPKRLAPH